MDRADALECVPVKNDRVRERYLADGLVRLSYPTAPHPWLERLLGRFQSGSRELPPKKVELDELGTDVWRMLDQHLTVRQLIDLFAEKHKLHPREAEVAVTRFLYSLGKRGVIGIK